MSNLDKMTALLLSVQRTRCAPIQAVLALSPRSRITRNHGSFNAIANGITRLRL